MKRKEDWFDGFLTLMGKVLGIIKKDKTIVPDVLRKENEVIEVIEEVKIVDSTDIESKIESQKSNAEKDD